MLYSYMAACLSRLAPHSCYTIWPYMPILGKDNSMDIILGLGVPCPIKNRRTDMIIQYSTVLTGH